ncbi:uncharacterized protein BO87DRAFT_377926 [Aspergillus neoniger CBS 115656]|uniref:Uncharacterized protein n=1 Tax=Aspergillus neoniger (strain CBS 115656) TaxID=1448310 RepID=A0A318YFL6_ASPNB|nr:hypothetical protein BO87DRAFT_377926 [Aspergillus neoniger CBS 115656]PYH32864.1 hypothetical protein BO87DRAFT_377926 [Aspergillus neoniger CBS 115656]
MPRVYHPLGLRFENWPPPNSDIPCSYSQTGVLETAFAHHTIIIIITIMAGWLARIGG